MKSKILDALKTRYSGVDETLLGRVAEKLAKTATKEEDVATAVDGAFVDILESYGDKRATEASKTAVANYERKHGLKDGKVDNGGAPSTTEPKSDEQQDGSNVPAWAQALIDSNKSLAARLDALDGERTATDRRGQINALLKDLPEQLRKPYARIDVRAMDDAAFGKLLDELPAEIAESQKAVAASKAVFGRPSVATAKPSSSEASDEEVTAVVERLNIR